MRNEDRHATAILRRALQIIDVSYQSEHEGADERGEAVSWDDEKAVRFNLLGAVEKAGSDLYGTEAARNAGVRRAFFALAVVASHQRGTVSEPFVSAVHYQADPTVTREDVLELLRRAAAVVADLPKKCDPPYHFLWASNLLASLPQRRVANPFDTPLT